MNKKKSLQKNLWVYKILPLTERTSTDCQIHRTLYAYCLHNANGLLFHHRKIILNHITNSIRNHSSLFFFFLLVGLYTLYTMQSDIQCHFGCFCNLSRFSSICLYSIYCAHSIHRLSHSSFYIYFSVFQVEKMEIMTLSQCFILLIFFTFLWPTLLKFQSVQLVHIFRVKWIWCLYLLFCRFLLLLLLSWLSLLARKQLGLQVKILNCIACSMAMGPLYLNSNMSLHILSHTFGRIA